MEIGVYAYINRLLKRLTPPRPVTERLASHSFRRGGAQHANSHDRLSAQFILDRGGWSMSATNKGFAHVFNTPREDRKVLKDEQDAKMDAARVDQLALVHAYYDGHARVRASSLQLPQQAYFEDAPRSARAQERASRKRKRSDVRQQELIAAGKFVPVDDSLIQALARAHTELLQTSDDNALAVACVSSSAQRSHDDTCTCIKALQASHLTLNVLHTNATDSVQLAHTSDADGVLLPPRSAFVQTDVRTLQTHALGRFQLIVMDPPWENKSVARGKQYTTFHHTELLKIDVPALADDRVCVLGIWVTNRPELTTFVLETLLPAWGFALHDTWYWLKVCANDALVTPLTSSHRLPFEKLIVATRCADTECARELSMRLGAAPKLRMSTPLRHSWKPPPESFFDDVVVMTDARKLELFARELRPDWTSIGNEVLKFQATALFDVCRVHGDSSGTDAPASAVAKDSTSS